MQVTDDNGGPPLADGHKFYQYSGNNLCPDCPQLQQANSIGRGGRGGDGRGGYIHGIVNGDR